MNHRRSSQRKPSCTDLAPTYYQVSRNIFRAPRPHKLRRHQRAYKFKSLINKRRPLHVFHPIITPLDSGILEHERLPSTQAHTHTHTSTSIRKAQTYVRSQ